MSDTSVKAQTTVSITVVITEGRLTSAEGQALCYRKVEVTDDDDQYFTIRGHIGDQVDEHHANLIIDSFEVGTAAHETVAIPRRGL